MFSCNKAPMNPLTPPPGQGTREPSGASRRTPRSRRAHLVVTGCGLAAALALLGACKSEDSSPRPSGGATSGENESGKSSSSNENRANENGAKETSAASQEPSGPLGHALPVGPPLTILPGQGIGPIRFGATFATVERHMQNPCDERTETKCVYVKQAVEFTMKDGVVAHIQLHRRDRPAGKTADGKPRYFGSYYGGLPPEIVMGLHKHVAVAELRPADRVEVLPQPDANGTVERHHYPGLIVEYDRVANGNTVLGGFQILPAEDPKSPALTGEELEAARQKAGTVGTRDGAPSP